MSSMGEILTNIGGSLLSKDDGQHIIITYASDNPQTEIKLIHSYLMAKANSYDYQKSKILEFTCETSIASFYEFLYDESIDIYFVILANKLTEKNFQNFPFLATSSSNFANKKIVLLVDFLDMYRYSSFLNLSAQLFKVFHLSFF